MAGGGMMWAMVRPARPRARSRRSLVGVVTVGWVVSVSFAAPGFAAPPVGGGHYYGFQGSETRMGDLADVDAEAWVARGGRRFAPGRGGSYVELSFDCRADRHGFVQTRVKLASRSRSVRIRREGRFVSAGGDNGLRYRLRGRFVTADYARLVYSARMPPRRPVNRSRPGMCRSGRSHVVLYRDGEPPFSGCRTQRARTLSSTNTGRIFEQYRLDGGEFFPHVYACLFETDERVLLGRNYDDERIEVPRLAGSLIAYAAVGCGVSGCQASIEVRDLSTGAVVREARPVLGPPDGPHGVRDLALTENGSLAWTVARGKWFEPRFSAHELWVLDSHGQRRVDSGPNLELESLHLDGSTITWVNDGTARSATLA